MSFTKVYGITTSSNNTAKLSFPAIQKPTTIIFGNISHKVPASSTTLSIPSIHLVTENNNALTFTINPPSHLKVFPSKSHPLRQPSTPQHHSLSSETLFVRLATLTFAQRSAQNWLSLKYRFSISQHHLAFHFVIHNFNKLKICRYFINNDIVLSISWGYGTNTRNMTITVNDVTTRVELPLSGKSSELFQSWERMGGYW